MSTDEECYRTLWVEGQVIPPKRCLNQRREHDTHLYWAPHLIEQFLNKPKQYRSVSTLHNETASDFLGTIHLFATVIWLNQ